jgi:hypothetical protein
MDHDPGRRALALAINLFLVATVAPVLAEEERSESPAVEQLRHAHGAWDATTEFLSLDAVVARSVEGTYEFEWVVPDRVLVGRSEIPELNRSAGILFFYSENDGTITMTSVGGDGQLWVMSGPADSEVRTTPPTPQADGSTIELRFTRYNVEPDRFESKMEYSTDGGKTWIQGNHQLFRRHAAGG